MKPIESRSHEHRPWAHLPFGRQHLREADRDQHEAEAHERTGRILASLPPAKWTVVGRFEQRLGRASHVVMGAGGVYLVTASKPEGCVRVKDGVPWSRRSADSRSERARTEINRRALEPAALLERQLRARSSRHPPVHPVVVLWSEFPQRVAETGRINFVHGRDLSAWLRGRPGELGALTPPEVGEIVADIAAHGSRRLLGSARRARAA